MTDKEINQLLALVIIQLIITFPICKIYSRAGYKWFWGLLTLIPLAGFFMVPGALGFTQWPSTTRATVKSHGQHSLIWVAAFSALFWFGIPGADTQELRSVITLASFIYVTAGVASIYENAGFSRWGGIMGLLGITNLIWPWILAFRKWPSLEKIAEFYAAEERFEREQQMEAARKFGIDGSYATESNETANENRADSARVSNLGDVLPPPIPKKSLHSESESRDRLDEDHIYERIVAELSGDRPRSEGVYLRAETEADGDQQKTRILYAKYRKEQLSNEN
jgi:hypothetical protein